MEQRPKERKGALQGGLGRAFQAEGTALQRRQCICRSEGQLRDQHAAVEVMRGKGKR